MSSRSQIADYEPVRPTARHPADAESEAGFARPASLDDGGVTAAPSRPTGEGSGGAKAAGRGRKTREVWSLRRGHAISYAGLFLFTAVLYFRPYEYLPVPATLAFWLAMLTLAAYFPSQLAAEGNLTARPREVKLLLLLCALALLSVPFAISPGEAWETFNDPFLKVVLMFLVIVNVVRTPLRLDGLLWLGLAVSCMLCVGAIREYRAGNFSVEGYRIAGSIGGMFGNPNDMALHLVTVVPLAFGLFMRTRRALAKILYFACVVLFAGGIVVTYSRGGFLGLVAVVFVLAWKLGRGRRVVVTAAAVFAVLLLLAAAPGNYMERVASSVGLGADLVGSSSMRKQLFWRSLFTTLHNPVFGIGMGNFHTVSIREQESHNAYTQVSAEMGLAAMAVYILFLLSPLRSLLRIERATFAERRRDRTFYLAVALQASLAGYMVSSFFASVAYQWYVYYLVGYAVALRRIVATDAERAAARAAGTGDAAHDGSAARDEPTGATGASA